LHKQTFALKQQLQQPAGQLQASVNHHYHHPIRLSNTIKTAVASSPRKARGQLPTHYFPSPYSSASPATRPFNAPGAAASVLASATSAALRLQPDDQCYRMRAAAGDMRQHEYCCCTSHTHSGSHGSSYSSSARFSSADTADHLQALQPWQC
jgi:hypothetical protein